MVQRILIILAWAGCFGSMNYGVKRMLTRMPAPASAGVGGLARYFAASPWTYALGALYCLGALLYVVSLRIMPLSVAGPIFLSLGFTMTCLLGVLVFHERITAVQAVGIVLCVAGIVLIALRQPTSSP
jgi:multidrug transporter EmrE-like cation transporter